ncbi:hypothetical protein [Mesorhizobium sp. Z1-4]|uniref:hypothetical protein n=1 Tax=Mesorhizobium sp. Z1-4 TaxID=2448478 RepID=UPI000FDB510D|nr:hypothetical protein [Mesorhizobium sp. Z1-4]
MAFSFKGDELRRMESGDYFCSLVKGYYEYMAEDSGIAISFAERNLALAHEFWLEEVDNFRRLLGGEPCQYKRAASLTYWLYREPPVSKWELMVEARESISGEEHRDLHDYLSTRGRELCAFRLGYDISKYYKKREDHGHGIDPVYNISREVVDDTIFLIKKAKLNVEGLYLSFKLLFETR